MKNQEDIEHMLRYIGILCERKKEAKWFCEEGADMYDVQEALPRSVREIMVNLSMKQCQILLNDYLQPIRMDWWHDSYVPEEYDMQKNLAIQAFYRCLNT